jgi:hypothetical protein
MANKKSCPVELFRYIVDNLLDKLSADGYCITRQGELRLTKKAPLDHFIISDLKMAQKVPPGFFHL